MEEEDKEKVKRTGQVHDSKEDAEKALYKNGNGVFIPSTWIKASLREAAKNFKIPGKGRKTYKDNVKSSLFVEPREISLGKKTYDDIDRQAVVVQGQRITRSRPRFNSWEITFTIKFEEDRIPKVTIKEILEEAGKYQGIGDYRSEYGRFKVLIFD